MVDYYSCKMSGSDEEFEAQMKTGMTKAEMRRVSLVAKINKKFSKSFFETLGIVNFCKKYGRTISLLFLFKNIIVQKKIQ